MLLKNTLRFFVARAVPSAIAFAGIMIFSRLLGAEGYGEYTLVLSFSALGSTVIFQWLRHSAVRFLSTPDWSRQEQLATIVRLHVLLIAASALIIFFIKLAFPEVASQLLGLTFVLLVGAASYELVNEIARSNLEAMQYAMQGVVRSILYLGLGVPLALFGVGASAPIIAMAVGSAAAVFFGIRGWIKPVLQSKVGFAFVRPYLSYGAPLGLASIFSYLMGYGDRLFLAHFHGLQATGMYSAAYDVVNQALGIVFTSVNLVAFPLAIKALEGTNGVARAREQLQKNFQLLLLLVTPPIVVFAALPNLVAELLLSAEFSPSAASVFPILALSTFAWGLRIAYFDQSFLLQRKTHVLLAITVVSAVLNTILNVLLIRPFGVLGAAYATAATFIFTGLLSILLGRAAFRLPFPAGTAIQVLISAALLYATLRLTQAEPSVLGLMGSTALGLVVYCGAVYCMNTAGVRTRVNHSLRAVFSPGKNRAS